jgi:hypothetical protein
LIIYEGSGRNRHDRIFTAGIREKSPAREAVHGGKKPGRGGNFPVYPASISCSLVTYPVSGKTGRFIMLFIPLYFHWNTPG